ncbi:protein-glutamate methylesterase/protein-glutamine glutaminase, partial [Neobacillus drentensis]|uniref:protein-glutamate methylesterase/protein-glutamine glutaminase n=1 Tax=Neobacillus drentensis TaxID=220684 RepID=UPI003002CFD3
MKQYGVLVVDDSAFMRRAISLMLEEDPRFLVVGIARNGLEAVEKVQRLKPDLVTMDVEMPEMNGLQALERIMKTNPVPIVMISSRTGEGAHETLTALALGAVDFFLKDNLIRNQDGDDQSKEFLYRLIGIVEAKLPPILETVQTHKVEVSHVNHQGTELIFIGCSTGGPKALQTILPSFPKDFPIPIVVAQHMPPGFTKHLAERFDSLCQMDVKEAQNGQEVKAGTIYICPSGFQTRFEKQAEKIIFKVENHDDGQELYKPSIDITLSSAAPIFTDKLLSVILTGMGSDGTNGCRLVKKYHGKVFVEAEASCIVYGMPRAVFEAGYADDQYELSRI